MQIAALADDERSTGGRHFVGGRGGREGGGEGVGQLPAEGSRKAPLAAAEVRPKFGCLPGGRRGVRTGVCGLFLSSVGAF